MLINRKARDADRHYAIRPSPAFFLCEFVVADPLDGHGAGQGPELIPDLQVFDRTLADRSRHARSPQQTGHSSLSAADRKSTRLNSSHGYISYAVFCLK